MLTVVGSQLVVPQAQSGTSGAQAQSVGAHGCSQAWHSMPGPHSASVVQCAGVQPISSVTTHGSGAGHVSPGAHAASAHPDPPTTVHSYP
jgi:hypothetical protein